MKFNDISDRLNNIRAVCKSTLFCQEYETLGLDQTECCNKASDMAAELWGYSKPRPHIRRAHWHTFLSGPRDSVRERRKKMAPSYFCSSKRN